MLIVLLRANNRRNCTQDCHQCFDIKHFYDASWGRRVYYFTMATHKGTFPSCIIPRYINCSNEFLKYVGCTRQRLKEIHPDESDQMRKFVWIPDHS